MNVLNIPYIHEFVKDFTPDKPIFYSHKLLEAHSYDLFFAVREAQFTKNTFIVFETW